MSPRTRRRVAAFLLVLGAAFPAAAPGRDCDRNGVEDSLDVETGGSPDCNRNGLPDACDVDPGVFTFGPAAEFPLLDFRPSSLLFTDIDGDGTGDAIGVDGSSTGVGILKGVGGGEFVLSSRFQRVSSGGVQMVLGDWNRDGKPDIALSDTLPGGFGVAPYLNDGSGAFIPATPIPGSGPSAVGLAAADLDGDGMDDLAVTDFSRNDARIFWSDGSARFTEGPSFPTGGRPVTALARDLEGDGDLDLVIASQDPPILAVIRNAGGRSFPDAASVIPTAEMPIWLEAADLDGDGDLDLAAMSGSGEVEVFRNDAGAGFVASGRYGWGKYRRSLRVAEVDGDGAPDLLTLSFQLGCSSTIAHVSILLNRGDGTFARGPEHRIQGEVIDLAISDIDADGDRDAVVCGYRSDSGEGVLSVFRGMRGAFSPDADADGVPDECLLWGNDCNWNGLLDAEDIRAGRSKDCDADALPDECQPDCNSNGIPDAFDLAAGSSRDLDGNGLPDECEANVIDCNANSVHDALDIQNGTSRDCDGSLVPDDCEVTPPFRFSLSPTPRLSLREYPGQVSLADLDLDGDLDAALAVRGSCCPEGFQRGGISIFFNTENGLVHAGSHAADGDAELIQAIDVDRDSDIDLVVSSRAAFCRGPGRVEVFLNSGKGSFARGARLALTFDADSMAAGDLDGDGDPDLVLGKEGASASAAAVFLNDGSGTFREAGEGGPPGGAAVLAAGDWDRDGRLDLAAVRAGPDPVVLIFGGGDGAFTRSVLLEPSAGSRVEISIAPADLDADGDLDLAIGEVDPESLSSGVKVLLNDGTGGFTLSGTHAIRSRPETILAADLDGDGLLDIASVGESIARITNGIPGIISVLRQETDGAFTESGRFVIDSSVVSMAGGDMDSDGDMDMIVADGYFLHVAVHANDGRGRFAGEYSHGVGSGPRQVRIRDLDADGDLDVATLNEFSSDISLLWNDGGTLRAGLDSPKVPGNPLTFDTGDLDGDGDLDFAVGGRFQVVVILNGGEERLLTGPSLVLGSQPVALVIRDLDGDSDFDIATANSLSMDFNDNVSVFLNEGLGAFSFARNFAVGIGPVALAATDLDGDGRTDLVTANRGGDLTLLTNAGGGTFAPPRSLQVSSTGAPPWSVEVLDLEPDGDPDLAVSVENTVLLVRNLGESVFILEMGAQDVFHTAMLGADLDGDGDPELCLTERTIIDIFRNEGGLTFSAPTRIDLEALGSSPLLAGEGRGGSGSGEPAFDLSGMAAADMDQDGDLDLALSLFELSRVSIALNQTVRAREDENSNGVPDACESAAITPFRRADPNSDGKSDITDAISILRHLFVTSEPLPCRKAGDGNDDGRLDLSDAVAILRFLFLEGPPPPPPFGECGPDPTPDLIECDSFPACP